METDWERGKYTSDFSLTPVFTVPLSNNARIYCHQICFSADVSRVLLINGWYVAPTGKDNTDEGVQL